MSLIIRLSERVLPATTPPISTQNKSGWTIFYTILLDNATHHTEERECSLQLTSAVFILRHKLGEKFLRQFFRLFHFIYVWLFLWMLHVCISDIYPVQYSRIQSALFNTKSHEIMCQQTWQLNCSRLWNAKGWHQRTILRIKPHPFKCRKWHQRCM